MYPGMKQVTTSTKDSPNGLSEAQNEMREASGEAPESAHIHESQAGQGVAVGARCRGWVSTSSGTRCDPRLPLGTPEDGCHLLGRRQSKGTCQEQVQIEKRYAWKRGGLGQVYRHLSAPDQSVPQTHKRRGGTSRSDTCRRHSFLLKLGSLRAPSYGFGVGRCARGISATLVHIAAESASSKRWKCVQSTVDGS